MTKSDSITKLADALSKAQAEMKGAIKDSNNPFFSSKYADLSSVWDACRGPLTKHGLSVVQTFDVAPDGIIIETTLCHASGEWISGKMFLNPTKKDPQGIGSAATYGRRYGLAAMVGICPEDDDGNGASAVEPPKKEATPPPAPKPKIGYFEIMEKERVRLGDKAYYNLLGVHGFTDPIDIKDRPIQEKIYRELVAMDVKKEG